MSFGENLNELVDKNSDGLVCKHNSWERVSLSEVVTLTNGFAFKSTQFDTSVGEPLLRIRDILKGQPGSYYNAAVDDPKMQHVYDGDVVVGMDGDFNSVLWSGGKVLINQRVCSLRCNAEFYSQKLLAYTLPAYLKLINEHTSSVTVKHLSSKTIAEIPLPLPPLNEQRRIVEKIETLFARLDRGEEAIRQTQKLLARYRQSVLKAAVTGELTADWRAERQGQLEHGRDLLARILETRREQWQGRGKYKEPTAPDTTDLPDLPEGWVWASLPMLGDYGRGKSKHRPRNDEKLYTGGKYPFLQTGRVRNSDGSIREYDKLYNEMGLAQSRLWPKGTVCITIAANIAETGILEIDACFPDSVVGLVPFSEISGRYVENFIRTAKENLDRYAPATAQKNINLEILSALAIPLPSPEEQSEIVSRVHEALQKAEAVEHWCGTELKRSAALRQSILKQAFAGKLVDQDPSDEPASALLARIAKGKAAAAPKKKTIRRRKAAS